jgi:hypothetical protein
MAVSQGLAALPSNDPLRHVPAVSLPNGCNSLPNDLIPLLDSFTKIYLWLDNDQSGIDGCSKFVAKLGADRCVVVKPLANSPNPPKDANDALRQGDPELIPAMLRAAQATSDEQFSSFADERAFVMPRVARTDLREGSQTTSLPQLSNICKGFRRGELVILTGPTGTIACALVVIFLCICHYCVRTQEEKSVEDTIILCYRPDFLTAMRWIE